MNTLISYSIYKIGENNAIEFDLGKLKYRDYIITPGLKYPQIYEYIEDKYVEKAYLEIDDITKLIVSESDNEYEECIKINKFKVDKDMQIKLKEDINRLLK